MNALRALILVAGFFSFLFVATQVAFPAIFNRPLFPLFRRRRGPDLAAKLAEANEDEERARALRAIGRMRERIKKIKKTD